jgi:DNA-binding NarL/FixJ family response regulator
LRRLHRALVVEDHAPFRRILCELLKESAGMQVVGEAADGLDAVRQAEALRPDVVVLDLNLPTLTGFEVASRIRSTVPRAKVIFLTVEASPEVVDHAIRCGAHGFVYKPRAQRDMLPVLEAIARGARFVNGGVERVARGDTFASHRHDLLFCSSDEVLIKGFSRFIANGLREGKVVVSLTTEEHGRSLQRSLHALQVDVVPLVRQWRYIPVNVTELFTTSIVDGSPDPARFFDSAAALVDTAEWQAGDRHAGVAACGEGTSIFLSHGHVEAALQLEHLWDEVAKSRGMDILCAFPLAARGEKVEAARRLCAEHSKVEIS